MRSATVGVSPPWSLHSGFDTGLGRVLPPDSLRDYRHPERQLIKLHPFGHPDALGLPFPQQIQDQEGVFRKTISCD